MNRRRPAQQARLTKEKSDAARRAQCVVCSDRWPTPPTLRLATFLEPSSDGRDTAWNIGPEPPVVCSPHLSPRVDQPKDPQRTRCLPTRLRDESGSTKPRCKMGRRRTRGRCHSPHGTKHQCFGFVLRAAAISHHTRDSSSALCSSDRAAKRGISGFLNNAVPFTCRCLGCSLKILQ